MWTVLKTDSFLKTTSGGGRMVFGGPICRAEQRRVDGRFRPSAVRVPQQATFCVACQGEFRWTPGKPSSARKKRKLGCISFGYLFFVQAKKSNSPKGEKQPTKHPQTHEHQCPPYAEMTKLKQSPSRMMHLMQLLQSLPGHMRINLRRRNIRMPKQHLHHP
jgi:hypothetical protein